MQAAAAMDIAARSQSGTYVAPPPLPGPVAGGSLAGTYVAPPLSGTYVAPPGPPTASQPSVAPAPAPGLPPEASLAAGSRVSVLQSNGSWLKGKVVCQDFDDSRYTILYDANWSTEVNVAHTRIVALPDPPPPLENGLPAFYAEIEALKMNGAMTGAPVFQGLASADSILEPLKQLGQGKSVGGISGGITRNVNGRVPAWPSFAAPAAAAPPRPPAGSYTMGGFAPGAQRAPAAAPPPAPNFRQVRPTAGSFPNRYPTQATTGGFNPGARAPAAMPQAGLPRSNAPRGRDTLGGTWRFT